MIKPKAQIIDVFILKLFFQWLHDQFIVEYNSITLKESVILAGEINNQFTIIII